MRYVWWLPCERTRYIVYSSFWGRPDRPEIASSDCFLLFCFQSIKLSFACTVPPDYTSGKFYTVAPFSITINKEEVSIFSVTQIELLWHHGDEANNLRVSPPITLVKLNSFQKSVVKYFSVPYYILKSCNIDRLTVW